MFGSLSALYLWRSTNKRKAIVLNQFNSVWFLQLEDFFVGNALPEQNALLEEYVQLSVATDCNMPRFCNPSTKDTWGRALNETS